MVALVLSLAVSAAPQMPLSVATTDDALAVFANPAGLGVGRRMDLYYIYNFEQQSFWRNSALALNLGPLGLFWEPEGRYGLALGTGSHGLFSGTRIARDSLVRWDVGALWRPAGWISLGAIWRDLNHDWGTVMAGAGIRPLGDRLTLSVDVDMRRFDTPLLGIEAEPADGILVSVKLKPSDRSIAAGLTLGLGQLGLGGFGSRVGSRDKDYQAGSFLRVGAESRRSLLRRPRRLLELELSGRIADQRPGLSLWGSRPSRTTWELLELVRRAGEDRSVSGLVLKLDGFSAGWAVASELRAALEDFKSRGKKLYVCASNLGMSGYYLATVADTVICRPLGFISVPGFSLQTIFLKGTLDKLGIEFEHQRVGEYKSAVETFTEDSLTRENREQLQALVDGAYAEFSERVSAARRMSPERLDSLVNQGVFMAERAKACGLVDTTCYADELDDWLKKAARAGPKLSEKEYRARAKYRYRWDDLPLVAIIGASGGIEPGESRTDFLTGELTMGANTMVRAVRTARKDSRVKAIVLRVDSPGGDGFASDLIWRELELAKKKKPVVVSMGDLAASGGYYISCGASRVFANPGTITGSIGGFSAKFVTEGLYNKLGARRQGVKRGERADAWSDSRGFSAEEDSTLQAMVQEFYDQFVDKVAEGRGLSREQVESAARGRVWTGSDACERGLVDSLGGLLVAVEWAKAKAGIRECDFVLTPKPRAGLLSRLGDFLGSSVLELGP